MLSRLAVFTVVLIPASGLWADTPVVNDAATQYTINQIAPSPACTTCDLSPSYNPYVASSGFNITKITFNWYDNGTGNACDGSGAYVAAISATNNAGGLLATSSNNIYLGCSTGDAPATGGAEFDFAGQSIPQNFYLDFYSQNGLEAGASVGIYNVEIWQLGPSGIFGSQLDSSSTVSTGSNSGIFNLGQSSSTSTQLFLGMWISTFVSNCMSIALQQADDASFTQNVQTIDTATCFPYGTGKFVLAAPNLSWIAGKYYRLAVGLANQGEHVSFYANAGGTIWFVMADSYLAAFEPPIVAGTSCLPSQFDYSTVLPGNVARSGDGERLLLPSPVTLNAITLWTGAMSGPTCCSTTLMELYDDNDGQPGNLIATTNQVTMQYWQGRGPQANNYTFPTPITLAPGVYWVVLSSGGLSTNPTAAYGSASDAFPGGYWAVGGLNQDAYFQISGTCNVSTGTIQVSANLAGASFSIIGPASYSGSGGGATFANAPVGTYTIIFSAIPGYATPAPLTVALGAGGTISMPGMYINASVQLGATLGSQSTSDQAGFTSEPINTATGNYFMSYADLVVPGKGLPFTFTRSYNSLGSYSGPLGAGWTHSFNLFLTFLGGGAVGFTAGDGHQEMFNPSGGGTYATTTTGVFDVLNQNADGTFTLTQKNQRRFNFSATGQLTSIVDRNGNTQTPSYGATGNLTSILDSSGRAFIFTTDATGRITSLTDPIGRSWQYSYDTNGNLVSVLDPNGGTTQYACDGNHRMLSATDPRGVTFLQNTYDGQGRVATQTNPRGFATTLAYNTPVAGTTTITDPLGNATQNVYDTSLRLVNIIDAEGGVQAYTYDTNNDRTSVTDQNGHTTTYGYDGNGNNTTIVDPLGDTAIFTYDAMNDLLASTSAKGNTITLTYDAKGNLLTSKDPLGDTTRFTYGTSGLLASNTDARGNTTAFSYDPAGNLIKSTDPLGNSTLFGYYAVGRLISTTDPNGHATALAYDNLNRMLSTTDPLGDKTQFAYDPVGNLVGITDGNGNATGYSYDGANNLTAVTDALAHLTTYAYDANSNRTSFTNAHGNTTTYQYDALNRRATIVDPLSFVTSYTYDPVGNLASSTDADRQINQYAYDALNRLTTATYADSSTVTYAYDADSNRTMMTDSHGATTYTYDTLDRVLSVTSPGASTVGYTYNQVGNRATVSYPDGRLVKYQYNKLNRLASVTDWAGMVTHYTYDKASNLVKATLPNATTAAYHYDTANRLTSLTNDTGATVVSRFAYTLDAVGNRLQITRDLLRRTTPTMRYIA